LLILGLNAFHPDAAVALYQDGRLVFAAAEERFSRTKHAAGFPTLALREAMRVVAARHDQIAAVAVARDGQANRRAKARYALAHPVLAVRKALANRTRGDLRVWIAESLQVAPEDLTFPIRPVEHHLAHAASAFLPSSFERAAVLTLDGFGDFTSALWGVGEGGGLRVLGRVRFPHSLGVFYTAVCQFIGFDRYGDEGKVMGLAPLGEPEYGELMERMLRLTPDGFRLDLRYFRHHRDGVASFESEDGAPSYGPLFSSRLASELGPPRERDAEITARDRNLAASVQRRLEQAVVHLANLLHAGTGLNRLCLAGGVALNGVANARILEQTPFERLFIQPAAGDDGGALGAAAWLSARAGRPREPMRHAFWGDTWDRQAIREALHAEGEGLSAAELPQAELLEWTAERIASGQVVGWFQGAMEWGPRALGNRSILAHPGLADMRDVLNARIKHREPFRPFAPAIKAERLGEYYHARHESPFMLLVYRSRAAKRAELAAVDHADHSGRVQTVTRDQNPLFYGLIDAFERRTGTPVLLNTSFNENEPIVRTPRDAIRCFLRTRMDALVLGQTVIARAPMHAPAPALAGAQRG
jgi:carbamoyltransferase